MLDMYEHAYHLDFGAKAADYVAASMGVINWSHADRLYAEHRARLAGASATARAASPQRSRAHRTIPI